MPNPIAIRYPPLQKSQGWGTHRRGVGDIKDQQAGSKGRATRPFLIPRVARREPNRIRKQKLPDSRTDTGISLND